MIVKNKIIPFNGFKAINLFGIIFVKKNLNNIDINHERIHTAQMKEWLFIGFYLLYITEYLINLIKYKNTKIAYKNISFEKEAYTNQSNLQYLTIRKHYNNYVAKRK